MSTDLYTATITLTSGPRPSRAVEASYKLSGPDYPDDGDMPAAHLCAHDIAVFLKMARADTNVPYTDEELEAMSDEEVQGLIREALNASSMRASRIE